MPCMPEWASSLAWIVQLRTGRVREPAGGDNQQEAEIHRSRGPGLVHERRDAQ